jgi:hypothetical protein
MDAASVAGTRGKDQREMTRRFGRIAIAATLALAGTMMLSASASAKGGQKTLTVCEHGCDSDTIKGAVKKVKDASKTTIAVEPGTYRGARFTGQKYNGLTITGTGEEPGDVILDGGCEPPDFTTGVGCGTRGQHGIEAIRVSKLKLSNMTATHFPINGFYIHSTEGHDKDCNGYSMKNLVADFNRSYGLFALHCLGGKIQDSVGFGHGDSAIYIGETPPQGKKKRKITDISGNEAYQNVLGYSGTNSKYVDIHDNFFYNNGAGVVPNTLDSELFEPAAKSTIHDNDIFWNNFDYYMPGSPVKTVSGGLGEVGPPFFDPPRTINFPTGIGVVLFGVDGWKVENNRIFGNFKYGAAAFSDPLGNEGDDAVSQNNRFIGNLMSSNGSEADANGVDFFADGSGSGNCYSGNGEGATFDDQPGSEGVDFLYPECPAPDDAGTGTSFGDFPQLEALIGYTTSTPPCQQEDTWDRHEHPEFMDFEPYEVEGTCPDPE